MLLQYSVDLGGLEGTFAKLQDPKLVPGILDEAQAILLNRIRQRFLAETDPDGTPWIPSRAGIKRRAAGGPGTLFHTGKLFHSIQLFAVTSEGRSFGTDVPYAGQHNSGTSGMIQRQFMGFSDEDENLMLNLVSKRITEALNG
jgi:phage gpG-like protein